MLWNVELDVLKKFTFPFKLCYWKGNLNTLPLKKK